MPINLAAVLQILTIRLIFYIALLIFLMSPEFFSATKFFEMLNLSFFKCHTFGVLEIVTYGINLLCSFYEPTGFP